MTSSMLYLYCSEQAGLLLSNAFALQASSCTMKFDIFHFFLLGYISHVWSVLSPKRSTLHLCKRKCSLLNFLLPETSECEAGDNPEQKQASIDSLLSEEKTFASNSCRLAFIHDVLFVVQQTEEKTFFFQFGFIHEKSVSATFLASAIVRQQFLICFCL